MHENRSSSNLDMDISIGMQIQTSMLLPYLSLVFAVQPDTGLKVTCNPYACRHIFKPSRQGHTNNQADTNQHDTATNVVRLRSITRYEIEGGIQPICTQTDLQAI
ncbi:hypothetical protein TNCT_502411 [Trichonephila clavata]|uniref:Uncharacterized protein n=1 Tax=Trichonephila clavata TaxID=2740835 RepID=A0A8X6ISJ2_TRICU|nr:hypothetical protein TNCT_502411 [Trichonephila clavata]